MESIVFYPAGTAPAVEHAASVLAKQGFRVETEPCPRVTHVLLPVPSFQSPGILRGNLPLSLLLKEFPGPVTLIGGNLGDQPGMDLLQDPGFLWENAAITAECALKVILARLPRQLRGCSVLILGWGRIGKHLSLLLQRLGASVTVAARKEQDRAALRSFGLEGTDFRFSPELLSRFHVILNTVPAPVLTLQHRKHCRPGVLPVELASSPGIEGSGVITARGLPGLYAPEAAGKLMADTAVRLLWKELKNT